jgi:hypothetical protein
MSDELLTAADVARRVAAETGRPVRPVKVGILARRGRIPIAARGPGRTLKFSDRAVSSMLAYERGRDGGGE